MRPILSKKKKTKIAPTIKLTKFKMKRSKVVSLKCFETKSFIYSNSNSNNTTHFRPKTIQAINHLIYLV